MNEEDGKRLWLYDQLDRRAAGLVRPTQKAMMERYEPGSTGDYGDRCDGTTAD